MQMTFVPVEDRILFRVGVADRTRAEFRFWVTRRYSQVFWQGLLSMLKSQQPKTSTEKLPDAPSQGGALSVEHQKAVADADFQTAYEESQVFPLGEVPILLSRVAVRNHDERGQMLCLHPQEGQGLEVALNAQMLHSLCKLLAESVAKANWDLNLDFSQAKKDIERGGLN